MSEPAMSQSTPPPESFGRYVLYAPIARGGMATVHTARLTGAEGFNRLVAAKRLHPQFAEDPDFVAMFHDEAHIASKIHHPNVVPVLDVVLQGQEVILVQEYVHGVPLDRLFNAALGDPATLIPIDISVAIIAGVLSGLHAAHETRDESNEALNIVHRDVSPQNVMVSVDGIPRLLDFGIAKAKSCVHVTREGLFKGKIAYMAPEQLRAEDVTRKADIYAAGVLLWELLAHRRLHAGRREAQIFSAVLAGSLPPLEDTGNPLPQARRAQILLLEPTVSRALASNPRARFDTAAQMLDAILAVAPLASPMEVAAWVRHVGAGYLERRQKVLASNEESWRSLSKIPSTMPSGAASERTPYSESGVKVVARETPPPLPASALSAPPTSLPSEAPRMDTVVQPSPSTRAALVPWSIAAALLLISGVLLGVLSVGKPAAEPVSVVRQLIVPSAVLAPAATTIAAAANPRETRPAGASAPPEETPVYSPVLVLASPARKPPAPPPKAAAPAPAPAPPPKAAAPAPAPAPVRAAPPAPAATPAAPSIDCNPPFYFEGSKKLYKPSCI